MTNGPVDSQICFDLCEIQVFLGPISYIIASKTVKIPLTPTALSWQPCGIERQMSPFWKLEIQGYNISKKQENLKILARPPPPYTLETLRFAYVSCFKDYSMMLSIYEGYYLAIIISSSLLICMARLQIHIDP